MSLWICSLALRSVSLTPFDNVEFPRKEILQDIYWKRGNVS